MEPDFLLIWMNLLHNAERCSLCKGKGVHERESGLYGTPIVEICSRCNGLGIVPK